jgi:hypothetical protein
MKTRLQRPRREFTLVPEHQSSAGVRGMNWTDEPATWKQLKYLKQVGYQPDHVLTKTEAAALISNFPGHPQALVAVAKEDPPPLTKHEARRLRENVEDARRAVADAKRDDFEKSKTALALAVKKRQEFWSDTCRNSGRVLAASLQVHDLYQKFGCRFDAPAHSEVQYILDALDAAAPLWDQDHPDLFYQTIELNFPHLLRRRE